jgi:hypothetical protein
MFYKGRERFISIMQYFVTLNRQFLNNPRMLETFVELNASRFFSSFSQKVRPKRTAKLDDARIQRGPLRAADLNAYFE